MQLRYAEATFDKTLSFSCAMRPDCIVYSAVLPYVLVHATNVLLTGTATFPLRQSLSNIFTLNPSTIPSDLHPAHNLLASTRPASVASHITHATRQVNLVPVGAIIAGIPDSEPHHSSCSF